MTNNLESMYYDKLEIYRKQPDLLFTPFYHFDIPLFDFIHYDSGKFLNSLPLEQSSIASTPYRQGCNLPVSL